MFKTVFKNREHLFFVQSAIFAITDDLRQRALEHDRSKFREDELTGYSRFEALPEGLEYPSDEFKEARAKLLKGNDCFKLHTSRNDHHPEYYADVHSMKLPTLIEMVCDWAGATLAYGNGGTWASTVNGNIKQYNFSPEQQWVIREVADLLEEQLPKLKEAK